LQQRSERLHALVIAAPAETHWQLAVAALEAGRHVLVEKPMAANLEQADHLAALAVERGLVLQVGHLVRYSAEYAAIAMRMGRPLYIEATRIAPFQARGTDVSVILDLMIHDLDLVLALVDSPIASVDAVGAPVAGPHEDIANARVRFANGCVATITASRISLKTERKMRLFAQSGYLSVDFVGRRLTAIGRERGLPIPGGQDYRIEETSWQEHDALEAEQAAFLAAVLDGAPVLVDAAAGRRALAAALAVVDSMAASRALAEASGLVQQLEHSLSGGG
jgi:predicted dehydrogenase